MPEVKFKHVVSCSSEDSQFPADNLLATESFKKWKCKIGEKQASVILQFENSTNIQSIDVGNDGSAFVELLVGRSADNEKDNYEVLLASQSFLSPTEGRQETNLNRVRIFNKDQLEKTPAGQKWDRLKIVCSQPYNKNIGYGLSFIRLHAPSVPVEKNTSIGKFTIKTDDNDAKDANSSFAPGAMFKQRSRLETPAAAEAPSIPSTIKQAADDYAEKQRQQKHHAVAAADVKTAGNSSVKRQDSNDSKNAVARRQKERSPPAARKPQSPPPAASRLPKAAAEASSTGKTKKPTYANFDKLFDGVVFVLSGFENPYRGQLRDKAVRMGAQYKTDWVKGCTHLVCAFKNTPKYNQVKGKGKIVKQDWILDSYKERRKLSWKKYAFEKPSSSESESEEKIANPDESVSWSTKPKHSDESESVSADDKQKQHQSKSPPAKKAKPSVYDQSTDEIDTDDEIERIKAKSKPTPAANVQSESESKPNVESEFKQSKTTTDGDDLPELPCFFKTFVFLLYGEFSSTERKQLNRYIVAFDGKVEAYMAPTVTHVLTHSKWNDDFDEALKENVDLIFVKPEWVLECGRKNVSADISRFLMTKS